MMDFAKVSWKQGQHTDTTRALDLLPSKMQTRLSWGVLGNYDPHAAYLCAVASAWVYSDSQTMADVMARQGLDDNLCIRIRAQNDALLVAATADLVLSEDGTVGVLCFRGTEPFNVISWLTDFTARPLAMPGRAGLVHGGMYRNLMAIWDDVVLCLGRALLPRSAPPPPPPSIALPALMSGGALSSAAGFMAVIDDPVSGGALREWLARMDAPAVESIVRPAHAMIWNKIRGGLTTLYLAGHSLGGAMAALAAVRLLTEPEYADIGAVLRGVYTFGQPFVANQDFVDALPLAVRNAVQRHVYARDIVPRLPSTSMGAFASFGPERAARESEGPAGDEVPCPWDPPQTPVPQLHGVAWNALLSVADFAAQQFPSLRRVRVPFSIENHLPRHYVACSLLPGQRSEFNPPPP